MSQADYGLDSGVPAACPVGFRLGRSTISSGREADGLHPFTMSFSTRIESDGMMSRSW